MSKVSTAAWPAERFYWAILDAPHWRRAGTLPAGLRPMYDDDVPVAGEDLHVVCIPLAGPEPRLLACGALRSELAALDPDLLTLTPDSLPPFVPEQVDPASLNLMVREFEPRRYRRARLHRHISAAASVLLCGLLIASGLNRRAEVYSAGSQRAAEARASLLDVVAPRATPDTVQRELASLRRASETSRRIQPPKDATLALSNLLRAWPAEAQARPQTLSISSSVIGMAVLVEGSPVAFLDALQPPSGWTMDQPRLTQVDKMTRLDLRFSLAPAEGGQQ